MDYLYETWHTCSSCPWLQNFASEEETFAEFGDEDDIEDVEDESFEQEGPLEEGLGEAEVEHNDEEEALVAETLLTGTQAA